MDLITTHIGHPAQLLVEPLRGLALPKAIEARSCPGAKGLFQAVCAGRLKVGSHLADVFARCQAAKENPPLEGLDERKAVLVDATKLDGNHIAMALASVPTIRTGKQLGEHWIQHPACLVVAELGSKRQYAQPRQSHFGLLNKNLALFVVHGRSSR